MRQLLICNEAVRICVNSVTHWTSTCLSLPNVTTNGHAQKPWLDKNMVKVNVVSVLNIIYTGVVHLFSLNWSTPCWKEEKACKTQWVLSHTTKQATHTCKDDNKDGIVEKFSDYEFNDFYNIEKTWKMKILFHAPSILSGSLWELWHLALHKVMPGWTMEVNSGLPGPPRRRVWAMATSGSLKHLSPGPLLNECTCQWCHNGSLLL